MQSLLLEIFDGIRYALLVVLTRENAGEEQEQAMGEGILLENVIGTSRLRCGIL